MVTCLQDLKSNRNTRGEELLAVKVCRGNSEPINEEKVVLFVATFSLVQPRLDCGPSTTRDNKEWKELVREDLRVCRCKQDVKTHLLASRKAHI